jgi:hypothetical protein
VASIIEIAAQRSQSEKKVAAFKRRFPFAAFSAQPLPPPVRTDRRRLETRQSVHSTEKTCY